MCLSIFFSVAHLYDPKTWYLSLERTLQDSSDSTFNFFLLFHHFRFDRKYFFSRFSRQKNQNEVKCLEKWFRKKVRMSVCLYKKRVSERVLRRAMHIIRSETPGIETLGEREKSRQASPQSLGSDYIHGSPQDSLRDTFFHAGTDIKSL